MLFELLLARFGATREEIESSAAAHGSSACSQMELKADVVSSGGEAGGGGGADCAARGRRGEARGQPTNNRVGAYLSARGRRG